MTESTSSLATAPGVLRALLAALNPVIPFVILRNYEGLPESWGNDVDILINASDLPVVRKITLELLAGSPRTAGATAKERFNFWSISLPCEDRTLVIDFTTAMTRLWFVYANTNVIFEFRRLRGGLFAVPDYFHELLLIAAKELFAYGYIREKYHKRLRGHDEMDSLRSASNLFMPCLTNAGCRLIASALVDPTVTGRPTVSIAAILRPRAMLRWMRLRRSGCWSLDTQ
mgnify:CR=1 FL=1